MAALAVCKHLAAVSCGSIGPGLGGVGFVFWLTGKLGRAWHQCMGGALVHGIYKHEENPKVRKTGVDAEHGSCPQRSNM